MNIVNSISSIKKFIQKHRVVFVAAFVVGIIYITPHALFLYSDSYAGIPMIQTANEDAYIFRMQEILDGHASLGSPVLYEYKEAHPLLPPAGEYVYALPSLIFGIPLTTTLLLSKFLLPVLLFIIIYFFVYNLISGGNLFYRKLGALTPAFLIVLGYDLVDYRTVLNFITGKSDMLAGYFLLWSRPVNPIFGAILLFLFLLLLWKLFSDEYKNKWLTILGAAITFALMIGNYIFSWGIGFAIAATLIAISLYLKKKHAAIYLISVLGLGFLLSLPYWISSWHAHQSPFYSSAILRNGIFYTHYPVINKLLVLSIVLYLVIAIVVYAYKKNQFTQFFGLWNWFVFALFAGSFIAFNQQIITGVTVWPYHFVQYTIPLSIIAILVLLYQVVRVYIPKIWTAGMLCIIALSVIFATYVQASVYAVVQPYYSEMQNYSELFTWLNTQEKDCVVLVSEPFDVEHPLKNLIPAFTHCNVYTTDWTFALLPFDRIYHNFLVDLRLRGIATNTIDIFTETQQDVLRAHLYSNWKGMFNTSDFPDVDDVILDDRIKKLPIDFRQFVVSDFKQALRQYQLDYILGDPDLSAGLIEELELEPLGKYGGITVYRFL